MRLSVAFGLVQPGVVSGRPIMGLHKLPIGTLPPVASPPTPLAQSRLIQTIRRNRHSTLVQVRQMDPATPRQELASTNRPMLAEPGGSFPAALQLPKIAQSAQLLLTRRTPNTSTSELM